VKPAAGYRPLAYSFPEAVQTTGTVALLTGSENDKLRINPRKSWYDNLDAVTTNGDFEVTFRLKRPQPSFLTLLASGWSPVYPCHVLGVRAGSAVLGC
jgi:peptide/nickel transport system substrate-binding protein